MSTHPTQPDCDRLPIDCAAEVRSLINEELSSLLDADLDTPANCRLFRRRFALLMRFAAATITLLDKLLYILLVIAAAALFTYHNAASVILAALRGV